jgi:hypothetical protein
MFYVIDTRKGYVTHESRDEAECKRYVANSNWLFGGIYAIVKGAKARNDLVATLVARQM